MRRRSSFSGIRKLRRTLRRIDPEVTADLKVTFRNAAETISNDAAAGAYAQGLYDSGDMIASITYKMGRDGLTAVIGPGADRIKISKNPFDTTLYVKDRDKHAAMQFFKAYWAEFGTKGVPSKGIPPQSATPFLNPAFDANKGWIARQTKDGISASLRAASNG